MLQNHTTYARGYFVSLQYANWNMSASANILCGRPHQWRIRTPRSRVRCMQQRGPRWSSRNQRVLYNFVKQNGYFKINSLIEMLLLCQNSFSILIVWNVRPGEPRGSISHHRRSCQMTMVRTQTLLCTL